MAQHKPAAPAWLQSGIRLFPAFSEGCAALAGGWAGVAAQEERAVKVRCAPDRKRALADGHGMRAQGIPSHDLLAQAICDHAERMFQDAPLTGRLWEESKCDRELRNHIGRAVIHLVRAVCR